MSDQKRVSQMKTYKELRYSSEYALGTMKVSDTVIKEREVQLMPIHVKALNSQFHNSGVKYVEVKKEVKEEAPKRTRRTKAEMEGDKDA